MSSKQPSKQRKRLYNLPKHKKGKQLSSKIDKKLKNPRRNAPLVKGDMVKVTIGKYKGKTGKVNTVNRTRFKIGIEGITRKKPDGSEVPIMIHPSNLLITELNLEDEIRKQNLMRK